VERVRHYKLTPFEDVQPALDDLLVVRAVLQAPVGHLLDALLRIL